MPAGNPVGILCYQYFRKLLFKRKIPSVILSRKRHLPLRFQGEIFYAITDVSFMKIRQFSTHNRFLLSPMSVL